MSNQTAHIEDPEELNILRAINRGETRLETVDWKPYLSDIVKMIGLMNPSISYIGCAWALLQEIDDFSRRADILSKWQDLAPQCFPTKEASDSFYADAECLIMVNIHLRGLVLMQGAQMPHTYDDVDGGKGLNEMALLWSDRYVEGKDLVALASEIHKTVSNGKKDPVIEYFLYCNRNYNQLPRNGLKAFTYTRVILGPRIFDHIGFIAVNNLTLYLQQRTYLSGCQESTHRFRHSTNKHILQQQLAHSQMNGLINGCPLLEMLAQKGNMLFADAVRP